MDFRCVTKYAYRFAQHFDINVSAVGLYNEKNCYLFVFILAQLLSEITLTPGRNVIDGA